MIARSGDDAQRRGFLGIVQRVVRAGATETGLGDVAAPLDTRQHRRRRRHAAPRRDDVALALVEHGQDALAFLGSHTGIGHGVEERDGQGRGAAQRVVELTKGGLGIAGDGSGIIRIKRNQGASTRGLSEVSARPR